MSTSQPEQAMSYTPEHKRETRTRIINSARRLFNRKGFSEVTIDEIMRHAGLTRGGFYKHFNNKEQLYAQALRHFLCIEAPERWQRKHVDSCAKGREFAGMIVNAYLSREHYDDRPGSCPVIALPSDVARSGKAVKAAFREVLDSMVAVFAGNLDGLKAREEALAMVATCVGAMVIARAVDDPRFGDEFRAAAHAHVLEVTGWDALNRVSARSGPRGRRRRSNRV